MRKYRRIILFILLLAGILFYFANVPGFGHSVSWRDSRVTISVKDNYLVFRDPECTKSITINDNGKILKTSYWSEVYDVTIYKRESNNEIFWVIDDVHRGVCRSENGQFGEFTCYDCSGAESLEGENIIGFELKGMSLEILHDIE